MEPRQTTSTRPPSSPSSAARGRRATPRIWSTSPSTSSPARGLAVEKIMLTGYRVLPCEGHDDCESLAACPLDDDATALLERMYRADGLILATPVYYEDVSGQMKVFIDRNCFNNYHEIWLSARSVGLIAVAESTGLDDAIDSLRRFVALSSDKKVKPLSVTGLAYRQGDAERNAALVTAVRDMAVAMAAALRPEVAS